MISARPGLLPAGLNDRDDLPQGYHWGRYLLGHSPDARGSETPCQPLRKPRTSLSLYRR
jgi:hypothetical protein